LVQGSENISHRTTLVDHLFDHGHLADGHILFAAAVVLLPAVVVAGAGVLAFGVAEPLFNPSGGFPFGAVSSARFAGWGF
jgi:hypothetical protein